jgi:predicted outer membrane repeat protein
MIAVLLSLLLCLGFAEVSAEHVRYVAPNVSLSSTCPGEFCLTLEECAQQANGCFTTGSVLEFMAGNHTLSTPVHLIGISDLTLRGHLEADLEVNIVCRSTSEAMFSLHQVTNMTTRGLNLHLDSISGSTSKSRTLFKVVDSNVTFVGVTFRGSGNSKILRGAIHALRSIIEIESSTFNGNTRKEGGALHASGSNVFLSGCSFISNKALQSGGAIYVSNSILTLHGTPRNEFTQNYGIHGGAIFVCRGTTLHFMGYNIFTRNSADDKGGALSLIKSTVIIAGVVHFLRNAAVEGGAVSCLLTNFESNEAYLGDIPKWFHFIGNTAVRGGAIAAAHSDYVPTKAKLFISGWFINNTASECGGTMYFIRQEITVSKSITINGSNGSAVCLLLSNITFTGLLEICNSTGQLGGGIYSERSHIAFTGANVFEGNSASLGGGIYAVRDTLLLGSFTSFLSNRASTSGGALYAVDTEIHLQRTVQFNNNSAENGGAIYLQQSACLIFATSFELTTAHNQAYDYGGVIFNEDVVTPNQCRFIDGESVDTYLPYCFFRLLSQDDMGYALSLFLRINVSNNIAGKGGDFLYGGLLDRCQLYLDSPIAYSSPYSWLVNFINVGNSTAFNPYRFISTEPQDTITSQPYQLCLCKHTSQYLEFSCSEALILSIYRGQKLKVPLLALDQAETIVSTTINVLKSSSARIESNQNPQDLPEQCSTLTYNLYSTATHEQLILYPDGPCRDSELGRVVIDVTFQPCPDAFTVSHDQCVCDERLQEYANCIFDDSIYIERRLGSKFWMSVLYDDNSTYCGLLLYATCPKEYCATNKTVTFTLDSIDTQCNLNRAGVLCGACTANHSLTLGSTKCQVCSNLYLTLIIPFAAAGIALVVFLSLLRLTVATGTINSIILYANIIQANGDVFLPNANTALTVFIAWLNLDLGIQTCFYDGMDAYVHTWLQFAFPLYVWILIGIVTLTSRYSITVSKLIGHNPIAVLATLLLMSYTKILNIVIEVYSSVLLEYPGNKTVRVWLKDANVPYLQGWHLLLTIVTTLCLVFLFIPYTLLLLLGHKLYHINLGKKWLRFMIRLKPLLDSYHAPYKLHTRYWTGFLLVIRCALYAVFSYNSLGGTTKSLLAILITFTFTFAAAWLEARIYKTFLTNLLEAYIHVNLVMLSGLALAEANTPAVMNAMLGIVFAATVAIAVYHFHILYTANSAKWLKAKDKTANLFEALMVLLGKKNPTSIPLDHLDSDVATCQSVTTVTKTVVDLREPLLENCQ